MRISDWSSDVCSSDAAAKVADARRRKFAAFRELAESDEMPIRPERLVASLQRVLQREAVVVADPGTPCPYLSAYLDWEQTGRRFISNRAHGALRSEEHTSELQSLIRTSYT